MDTSDMTNMHYPYRVLVLADVLWQKVSKIYFGIAVQRKDTKEAKLILPKF